MKKWLIRSSTGNASARIVETSGGVRLRVPGKGAVFAEMSETCADELRSLPGVSVELVTRPQPESVKPPSQPVPEPADDPPASAPKPKRKRAPRKPKKK